MMLHRHFEAKPENAKPVEQTVPSVPAKPAEAEPAARKKGRKTTK